MNDIDIKTLKRLLRYDADSGALFWKHRDREFFKTEINWRQWNSRLAGKQAFLAKGDHGYYKGTILNKWFRAHRVIWALHYGEWPNSQIDHIDGDRANNRINNLRAVSHQENGRNQKKRSTNTSGYTGVGWHKQTQRWSASIRAAGRVRHIGLFSTIEEAASARKAAERELGFHPNHGRAANG